MLKKNSNLFILINFLVQTSFGNLFAQSKKDEPYLHQVSIGNQIEMADIYSFSKNRIKFKTKDFSSRVRKYDVFLVLNDDLNAILAEVVVVKLSKRKTIAYAKKSRIAGNLKLRQLVGKKLMRVEDLKQALGSILLFRSNPLAHLNLFGHSFISSAANVLTGNNLNPKILAFGANLKAFFPKSKHISWLNWFGLRYTMAQQQKANIKIKTSKTEIEQSAFFTGDSASTELIVQPWFEYSILYYLSLFYGISNKISEEIAFEGGEISDEISLVMEREYQHIGLEIAFNPIHNIYAGFLGKNIGEHSFGVTDTLNDEKQQGLWSATYFSFWAATTVAIAFNTKLSFRYNLIRREDVTSEQQTIGSGNGQKIIDWEQKVEIGVVYAP